MNTEVREARRAYVHRYPPREASPQMPEENFRRLYFSRWTFQSHEILQEFEQREQALFCLNCCATEKWGVIMATRLYVTYEEDVLKNFKSVLHARCGNCDAEEMIGMDFAPSEMVRVADLLRHESPEFAVELRKMLQQAPWSTSVDFQEGMMLHVDEVQRLRKKLAHDDLLRRQQMLAQQSSSYSDFAERARQNALAAYGLPPTILKDIKDMEDLKNMDMSEIERRIIAEKPGLWQRITGGKR